MNSHNKNDSHFLLSLLAPVYNVEKYLSKCLDSIFSQISEDCEVILVDDGSTDESGRICDLFQERYPNYCRVFHKDNQGAYPTRNFALDVAKGDYIWLIDPDDYIEPNAISDIKNILCQNENLDIISAAYRKFSDSWIGEIENTEHTPRIVSGEDFLVEGHFHEGYLWNHIYRHEFLTKNEIRFNNELNTQGDWLFNAYAYVAAKRIYLSDKLIYNYYKGNPTSTLARRDKQHLLRGVENSMKAELEMSKLCEKYKNKPVYEPLSKRLALGVSGFIYSLYRFYIPIDVIKNALRTYRTLGLYPIKRSYNRKANLFNKFANCEWLFIFVCRIRNFIHNH